MKCINTDKGREAIMQITELMVNSFMFSPSELTATPANLGRTRV